MFIPNPHQRAELARLKCKYRFSLASKNGQSVHKCHIIDEVTDTEFAVGEGFDYQDSFENGIAAIATSKRPYASAEAEQIDALAAENARLKKLLEESAPKKSKKHDQPQAV